MRIGIDCRMLGPEQGGLGRYVEQLILNLNKHDAHNEYVLFLRTNNFDYKIQGNNFKYKKVLVNIPWYGWREQIFLPNIIKQEKLDLMHFPHWNVSLGYNGPFVVTIHDLLLLEYPTREASTLGLLSYWFKNIAYKIVLNHAAKKSSHILTTSEFTKTDIVKKLGIQSNKLTVTYQAPFLHQSEYQNDSIDLTQWGITKPYLLYVGVAYPHKNLDRLVEALALVQAKTNFKYQLVLAGKSNYFYQKLQKKVQVLGLTDIIFTDFIKDQYLSGLYSKAKLFVYPSLYEGFGLPPLEAWEFGVPVVASNRSCLPEVLGSGALYFDPESVTNMAEVIVAGLTDSRIRQELQINARAEKTRFSWDKFTEQTLQVYNQNRTQAK